MNKILIFFLLLFFSGCSSMEYHKFIDPALENKKADKRENPIYFDEIEPPMPTKSEIEDHQIGADKNNNGIRDDIDIYINRTFKEYNLVMVARQFAFAYENFYRKEVEWMEMSDKFNQLYKVNPKSPEVEMLLNRMNENSLNINKNAALMINAQECMRLIADVEKNSFQIKSQIWPISMMVSYPNFRGKIFEKRIKGISEISLGSSHIFEGDKYCTFKIENITKYRKFRGNG